MEDFSLADIAGLVSSLGVNGVLSLVAWVLWKRYTALQDTINAVLFSKINGKPKEETDGPD